MKLFKCHAVMPLVAHERTHRVRTYLVIAHTWQEARARIWNQQQNAEFVTVPCEMPGMLMTEVSSMSESELADLRSACDWNESQLRNNHEAHGRVGKPGDKAS